MKPQQVFTSMAAAALAVGLAGCGGPDVTYKPSGTYTTHPSYGRLPAPTSADLDKRFHDALDPNVPEAQRLDLIQDGYLFKGDLPSFQDARNKNPNAKFTVVDPVFDNHDGTVTATFRLDKTGDGRQVHSIPVHFIAIDGKWKLSRTDLCGILTSNDYNSKACG